MIACVLAFDFAAGLGDVLLPKIIVLVFQLIDLISFLNQGNPLSHLTCAKATSAVALKELQFKTNKYHTITARNDWKNWVV